MDATSANDGERAPASEDRLARARADLDAGQLLEARRRCLEILAEDPGDVRALNLLGQVELHRNEDEQALAHFRTALELEPENVVVIRNLALAQSETGDLAAGERTLRRALSIEPKNVSLHQLLSVMKRYVAGDPDLQTLESLAADAGALTDGEAIQLGFALGKALEDVGEYERAFTQLSRANSLRRQSLSYDLAGDLAFMDRVRSVFDRDRLTRAEGLGTASQLPVLIVGMPRSGTTLVEQIIVSHPLVGAGGERADLAHVASAVALLGDAQADFPEGVRGLPDAYLGQLGAGYAARLSQLAPGAVRVTDKNLFNFAYLGMAQLIAPGAQVIHCVREPLDTCVSCFGLNFARMKFAFDLEELGAFHRGYRQLMEHWRTVLPVDWVLDVHYEELVEDPEGVSRRIIDHVGLEWDARCLQFQRAQRNVRTASFAQVRRPVTGASVGRWRRYEPWLGPLISALAG